MLPDSQTDILLQVDKKVGQTLAAGIEKGEQATQTAKETICL
jgi:hypothetical protein